ncbi:MAG TPA: phosphodiester glycosidase family protein [Candidatus Eisenbacteria bacterium]|nr:phosphodiester glycosidase family protein [Candidatus Eisenbacteria bacterium]
MIRRAARAPAARLAIAALGALLCGVPSAADGPSLSLREGRAWRIWWRADQAPAHWSAADTLLAPALTWRRLADGIEWATGEIACSAPAWRTRLIVARIDPARVTLSLAMDLSAETGEPAWSIDRAPAGALLAVNAGQFISSMPWGWVVIDGRQRLSPGSGPLARALAIDSAGTPVWLEGDALAHPPAGVRTAFQSYPTLLVDGTMPVPLRAPGAGVDFHHRDARLAIGGTRDGRLIVAMTRFAGIGALAERVPLGPTTPEMAAIMGALGARDALMLDGGISAQMLLRDPASGRRWRWPGMRKVPMALIARPRGR